MATCNKCGMDIPDFGSVCPYCRIERDDLEIQERAVSGTIGFVMFVALAFLLSTDITWGVGLAIGGGVIGMAFPKLMVKLFVVGLFVFPIGFILRFNSGSTTNQNYPPQHQIQQNTSSEFQQQSYSSPRTEQQQHPTITIGMTTEQVKTILGEPHPQNISWWQDNFRPLQLIWRYEHPRTEIHFSDGKVVKVE